MTSLTRSGPDFGLTRMTTPIGRLEICSDPDAIFSLAVEQDGMLPHDSEGERPTELGDRAAEQIATYFTGDRDRFDLPTRLVGTAFQRHIWQRLAELGWGDVTTYGALAASIGRPTAVRAVGQAVAANPLPVIIGCHRVLSATGSATGYSHGRGLDTKLWLLSHEGALLVH